jgi:hypothetical protein
MAIGNNIGKPVTYTDKLTGKKVTITPASQGGYMNAYDQYAASKAQGLKDYEKQLNTTLEQNNATTNANYDNSARQAYVDYMRKQRALPSQLQALGVNGGATESGLLNLYSNYGSSHAANEQQRNADLTTNQQNRDDAYNAYRRAYQEDLDNQYQTALSNQMNEYNNEITRFSSSVAQYPTTEKGYKNYQKWIENMKKSDDPLKDIKVALIRQQMATQFPDGAPKAKSSGGGGRRYGGYSGGYSSGGSSSDTDTSGSSTPTYTATQRYDTAIGPQAPRRSKSVRGGRYYTSNRNINRAGIW